MQELYRIPCPRCSPKTEVITKVATEWTVQGNVTSLTCVLCGYSKEVLMTYSSHDGVKQDV